MNMIGSEHRQEQHSHNVRNNPKAFQYIDTIGKLKRRNTNERYMIMGVADIYRIDGCLLG
ncbi:MAG: hypothetical protein AN485_24000 [Anabaena sp. MDT14b]|nr:MAG: hypothetical protein AN485_24000 [Anabaena sp. MDT14b]